MILLWLADNYKLRFKNKSGSPVGQPLLPIRDKSIDWILFRMTTAITAAARAFAGTGSGIGAAYALDAILLMTESVAIVSTSDAVLTVSAVAAGRHKDRAAGDHVVVIHLCFHNDFHSLFSFKYYYADKSLSTLFLIIESYRYFRSQQEGDPFRNLWFTQPPPQMGR